MKMERKIPIVLVILVISTAGMFFVPAGRTAFVLLPVLYLLVEKGIAKRSWHDLGFLPERFIADVRGSWFLFLFAGIGSQSITALCARYFFPAFLDHVRDRLSLGGGLGAIFLLPLLALMLMGEELTFRGLYQNSFAPRAGVPAAVILASAFFAAMHYSPAPEAVLVLDLGAIFIDGILYGILFARSGNILVVWASHLLGDIASLYLVLWS